MQVIVKNMEVKVKYHADGIEPISSAHTGEWVDLRCAEDVELKKGDFKLINLGVSIAVPEGFEAILAPRSSTFKRYGILQTNGIGVVDFLFRGNEDILKMPVYATRDTFIHKNDRICQFRIQRCQPSFDIVEIDNMEDESRGGLGSTGV